MPKLRFLTLLKKLLRQTTPDPRQLTLQFDLFSADFLTQPKCEAPTPVASPRSEPPSAQRPGTPNGKRRVNLGDHMLEYTLRRSKRRSIGFLIDDDGLRISAPRWVTIAEIDQAIREKQRWIIAKLL